MSSNKSNRGIDLVGELQSSNLNKVSARADRIGEFTRGLKNGQAKVVVNKAETRFRLVMKIDGMDMVAIPKYDPQDLRSSFLKTSQFLVGLKQSPAFQDLLTRSKYRVEHHKQLQKRKIEKEKAEKVSEASSLGPIKKKPISAQMHAMLKEKVVNAIQDRKGTFRSSDIANDLGLDQVKNFDNYERVSNLVSSLAKKGEVVLYADKKRSNKGYLYKKK